MYVDFTSSNGYHPSHPLEGHDTLDQSSKHINSMPRRPSCNTGSSSSACSPSECPAVAWPLSFSNPASERAPNQGITSDSTHLASHPATGYSDQLVAPADDPYASQLSPSAPFPFDARSQAVNLSLPEDVARPAKRLKTSSSSSPRAPSPQPQRGRVPHNLVERRYRENLKYLVQALGQRLPSLEGAYQCVAAADIEDSTVRPPSKATIIAAAINYIEQLEFEKEQARGRIGSLREQVDGLQKLVRCDDCSILKYFEGMQMQRATSGEGCVGGTC